MTELETFYRFLVVF